MKKLSSVSLFIFAVAVISILTAGLVFYQNSKNVQSTVSKTSSVKTIKNNTSSTSSNSNIPANSSNTSSNNQVSNTTTVLNIKEISKHNNQNDCWLLISGKVYDITSYFGSHPGGNSTMSATCGTDASNAYMTQDPYASSSSSRSAHSSRAKNMLSCYYVGDLGQSI
jgi:cytochrome b involved in lipid metabolism